MIPLTLLVSIALTSQLSPSADPQPIPIPGVVVDPSGKPAADAAVWLIDGLPPGVCRRVGLELFWMEPYARRSEDLPRICLEARTDAAGKFTLEVPAEFAARRWQSPLVLVAYQPGMQVTLQRCRRRWVWLRPQSDYLLAASERTTFRVLDPGGKLVAGAKVSPSEIDDVPIPHALGRLLGNTTDGEGRVVLMSVPHALLQQVEIDAPGFGRQRIRIDQKHVDDLRLAPVGRFVGRLAGPANEPVRGVAVRASTLVDGYEGSGQEGLAEVACDASGRIEIPAIAAGLLTLDLVFDPRTGTRLRTEPSWRHRAGGGHDHRADNPPTLDCPNHGISPRTGNKPPDRRRTGEPERKVRRRLFRGQRCRRAASRPHCSRELSALWLGRPSTSSVLSAQCLKGHSQPDAPMGNR